MMNELQLRLKKLEPLSKKMDAIMIFNSENLSDPNFFYFTNTDVPGLFYYDFSEPVLYTNEMELSRAKKSWIKNITITKPEFKKTGTVGINKSLIIAKNLESIKSPLDISKNLEEARIIKTKYEINCINKACRISTNIFSHIQNEISRSITEIEFAAMIDFYMAKKGCSPAFPTIIASGKNVIYPHHKPTAQKLLEPIILDFGAKYNGYCSDISRTIGSHYSKQLDNIIKKAEERIKPGIKASTIDIFVRKELGDLRKYFIHSLGHGFGIAVHERPWIYTRSEDVLEPGMVFTIEPGVYLKNGCRIEHDYLLTEDGIIKLDLNIN